MLDVMNIERPIGWIQCKAKQMFRFKSIIFIMWESQCTCSVLMFHDEESVKCSTRVLYSDCISTAFALKYTTLVCCYKCTILETEMFMVVELPNPLQEWLHTCNSETVLLANVWLDLIVIKDQQV